MVPTALVTGASAGIGEATVHRLVAAGYRVIATARREDRLQKLANELDGVTPWALDVTDPQSVQALLQAPGIEDLTLLVNNAGLAKGTDPMHEAKLEDWDTMVATNVTGLLHVTRALLPILIANTGDVVNLGSVAGRWVYPGGGVYCATKFAVRALSEGLRFDLAGTGVRVVNIEPGLVETEFSRVRFDGDEKRAGAVYANTEPLVADDVAQTIVWTVSRPRHVNVQELVLYPTMQSSVRDVVRHNA